MKAQFKYSFLAGLPVRSVAFGIIFIMDLVFIILGSFGLLSVAAQITAVSLGGVAISVMLAVNIVSDVTIARRMFSAPGAYLHALAPAPRGELLFASLITMMVLDIVTMAVVIVGEVWMSMIMVGENIRQLVLDAVRAEMSASLLLNVLWCVLVMVTGYLLVMMIILFCVTARKSIFYQKPAAGLLTFLLACACVYAFSLLQLVLAPFGTVQRYGLLFVITIGDGALLLYNLLALLAAAGLFALTSRLMERKMNI